MAIVKGTNRSELLDTRDGVTGGNDAIYGYDGDDTIYAYNGNDFIRGGSGADYIDGGGDIDVVDYVDSTSGVWVDLRNGQGYTGYAKGDTLLFIENINGSVHDDFLIGNDESNQLAGYYGKDTLKGGGGSDKLIAGEGDDWLEGGAGADELDGGLGVDTMSGDSGNDLYAYVEAHDIVNESANGGYDTVLSAAEAYTLTDNVEMLRLYNGVYGTGNAQTNTILGNARNNLLNGGGGADDLSGLGGDDIFAFRAGQAQGDAVYEFNGNGAGSGDVLLFSGYGTREQGARISQLDATHWQVTSANGAISETITLVSGYVFDPTHDVMFV